jgi:hypothetical protein
MNIYNSTTGQIKNKELILGSKVQSENESLRNLTSVNQSPGKYCRKLSMKDGPLRLEERELF